MKQKNIFKKLLTLVLLLVGSTTGAWAEETIATFTASTYNGGTTEGWAVNSANYATANNGYYQLISSDASIVTPSINWSDYTDITITITARKYGGPDPTQGKISVNQGNTELASYSPTGTSIASSGALEISPTGTSSLSIACLGASNNKGCGVQTITIKGTLATTTPSISAANVNIDYNETEGTIESTINNPVDGGVLTAAKETEADWLTLGSVSETNVPFTTTANEGNEDREATVTLTYTYGSPASTVTKNVTITQKHFVADYATLPFNWDGGSSADLLALDGVTASGLGNDYGSSYIPYNVKFDTNNDYIQIKTDSKPGIVTIGVEMVGGPNTSYISVQGSADGETFTEVEKLTISGSQYEDLNLTTSNDFANTDRYVRLVFTKGSNVGVGPITISKGTIKTTTTTTIDATGITNTNLDDGTAAGKLTASVKAGDDPVVGATVAWTSDDESVATVDEEGNVTLISKGTATITASYAGDETYASSYDTYELKVTSSAQVMSVSIDLTNTFWGQDIHTSGDATEDLVFTGSKENIIVTYYVPKGSHYYFNTSNTRVYDTDDIQVDAPAGYVLETITFTSDGSNWNDATPTTGAMSNENDKLWEGPASTVRFHWSTTGTRIKTIVVTLKEGATVSDAKWATYVTPKDIDFSASTGVTAYKVTGANGKIELEEVDAAPKGTPLVIAAEENTYVLNVAASAPAAVTGNLLKAADGNQTGDGAGNYYVLGKDNENKVGFGPLANGVKLAKGKAYINGDDVSAKTFLPFVIGDEESETTSINSIENSELRIENSDSIYNLAGQRVSKDYKGIVVVNGKKFVRK